MIYSIALLALYAGICQLKAANFAGAGYAFATAILLGATAFLASLIPSL